MNVVIAQIKNNFKNTIRSNYISATIGRLFTSIYIVIFSVFLFKYMANGNISKSFMIYTDNIDYLSFIVIGSAFYTLSSSVLMAVGRTFMDQFRQGVLNETMLSPASRIYILLGNGIEQYIRSIVEFLITLLISMLIGINFIVSNISTYIMIIIITFFTLFSIGVFLSFVMLYMRDTYLTQNTFFLIIGFLCGISFPIKYLPKSIQLISNLMPFTHLLEIIRKVFISGEFLLLYLSQILLIFIMDLFFLISGILLLKNFEKKHSEKFIL